MADNQRHPERLVAAKVRPWSLTTTKLAASDGSAPDACRQHLVRSSYALLHLPRGHIGNELDPLLPVLLC